jgi:hypothetical protein
MDTPNEEGWMCHSLPRSSGSERELVLGEDTDQNAVAVPARQQHMPCYAEGERYNAVAVPK